MATPGSNDPLSTLERRGLPIGRTWRDGALRLTWYDDRIAVAGFLSARGEGPIGPPHGHWPTLSPVGFSIAGFAAGLAFCLALAVVEWSAWALVRPGRRLTLHDPEPIPWEPISTEATDGVRLAGAWLPSSSSGGRTAVLLHGFAEDRIALIGRAQALHARGWNVALVDSRGRGRSGGDACSFGGRESDDLRRWVDVLRSRVGPSLRLLAWGRSMGAAIALRAAVDEPKIGALVLEAPYPGPLDHGRRLAPADLRLPRFFARPILRRAQSLAGVSLEWPRPIDLAPRLGVPTLILHGSADPIVSVERVRRLADAFPKPATVIELAGARHADVFDVGGTAALADRIAPFADRAIPRRPSPDGSKADRDNIVSGPIPHSSLSPGHSPWDDEN